MTASDLAGKRILVTGASKGLGRAIADHLHQLGAIVFGTSRDVESAEQIAQRYGTRSCVLDVRDSVRAESFIDELVAEVGGIDAVVNNAGLNIPKDSLDVSVDDWRQVHETNLEGPFFITRALARHWLQLGMPGAVVNIASQAGIVAIEERAAYGSSKAGLIHLTRILALEWAQQRIRVNAIAPTFVRTEMTASTLARADFAETLLSRIPMGRFGEPEDLLGAVEFLLSDASAFITGQTIVVDGGYTLR